MNSIEMLKELREVLDDEVTIDAGWSDTRLYELLSEGQREFCFRTGFIIDKANFAIATSAAVEAYPLDSRIIKVIGVAEATRQFTPLDQKLKYERDVVYGAAYVPHAVSTVYLAGARVALPIAGGSDSLVLACTEAGTSAVTAPVLTEADIETIVVDGTASWKVERLYVDPTGTPTYFETDEDSENIYLSPAPNGVFVLNLRVCRYPLNDIDKTYQPEISSEFHRACIAYAAAAALTFGDDEIEDLRNSGVHTLEFDKYVRRGKAYVDRRENKDPNIKTPRAYRT